MGGPRHRSGPGRLVHRPPEGGFFALEWLVEGRVGGTKLRCVASGFLPGDDWEAEFESLKAGGAMYFDTLVQYLAHFSGRPAQVVDALSPPVADWDAGWRVLTHGLGLNGSPAAGDQVRLTPDVDRRHAAQAWQAWLNQLFAG